MSDTPETDHLENQLGSAAKFSHPVIWRHARQLEIERDEARSELYDIRLNLGADAEGSTLIHAVCVLQQERDEAREALMKIEDLFIDGTDIYADREKMGTIARNALEETK